MIFIFSRLIRPPMKFFSSFRRSSSGLFEYLSNNRCKYSSNERRDKKCRYSRRQGNERYKHSSNKRSKYSSDEGYNKSCKYLSDDRNNYLNSSDGSSWDNKKTGYSTCGGAKIWAEEGANINIWAMRVLASCYTHYKEEWLSRMIKVRNEPSFFSRSSPETVCNFPLRCPPLDEGANHKVEFNSDCTGVGMCWLCWVI